MIWSFSAHSSFRKCPRQWFYKRSYANSRANDPLRREAQRLSKLEGLRAWRGKIVDTIISEVIIPSLRWNTPCSVDQAKTKADQLFLQQRAQRIGTNREAIFFEVEYGLPLTEELFADAREEIHTALDNFYKAEPVWALLKQAKTLVPQRPLSFKHGAVSVRVVPDLICFHTSRAPAVLDWKVNTYPMRDYWLQLVTGAMGVTRCNAHRDWPIGAAKRNAHEVELFEVQLLTGDIRSHMISENDVHDAEDFISISSAEMGLACAGCKPSDLRPEDFPVTCEPKTCQFCPFKKLCWGAGS